MQVIRIIQLGDIHYPDEENRASPVDSKDPGFPASLRSALGTPPLQAVFREVARLIDRDAPALVSFMGDFTNRGEAEGLAECLSYVRKLFPDYWDPSSRSPSCQLLIGNHDVDRRKDPELETRFHDINVAIESAGLPQASVLAPHELILSSDGGSEVRVFGINSCRGCGQIRRLGGILEKKLGPEIARVLAEGGTDELNEVYESIDTPAIEAETLDLLRLGILELPETSLPVIAAHHNLLPQTTPRIAPYSELLNAGSVRAALLALRRPVVFLHGHLHDDPVEIVRTPAHPHGAIISVSAPLLRDGFNVVEIAFGATGVPLGCQIAPFRMVGGHVVRQDAQMIPLWTSSEGMGLATPRARDLMKHLEPCVVFFQADLVRRLGWAADEVDDALIELRWLGLLQIRNPERPSMHWRCERVI